MATYTITGGSTTGLSSSAPKVRSTSVVVDFSSTTNVAGDVFECIEVPANTYVVATGVDILTVDSAGNSGTIILGDGGDDNRYLTASTLGTAGQMTMLAQSGASNAAIGYNIHASADSIDIKTATGAINAVVRVWAVLADVDGVGDGQGQTVTFA